MNMSTLRSIRESRRIFSGAIGKACWHVTVGRPTLPEFSLAFGRKIKRERPLNNLEQTEVFRHNEGEISMFIRTVWRLEQLDVVIASSDDKEAEITAGLSRIVGQNLVGLKVVKPAWDLTLQFANGLRLKVFCERTERGSMLRRNWQARIGATTIYAGPGSQLQMTDGN
jgi:hypothetical protein